MQRLEHLLTTGTQSGSLKKLFVQWSDFRPYAVVLLVVSGALACVNEAVAPTGARSGNAVSSILDGRHNGGNAHFFFLPPMVAAPAYGGITDAEASPTVVICTWSTAQGSTGVCEDVVAVFSREEGTGSEVIRFDAVNGTYAVNWHTDRCLAGSCSLSASSTYRLRVLIGAAELGHADVVVGATGQALKNLDDEAFIPLVNGRTLPVRFRIEVGAVSLIPTGGNAPVGNAGGELATSDGSVALAIPAGALTSTTSISVAKVTESLPGAGDWATPIDLGPDGTTFAEPARLTLSYDASKLPEGVTPEELRLSTWVDDHWEVVPGNTLNRADGTISADIDHFSYYGLSIWPNAVTSPTGAIELTAGQRTTFGGYAYYVYVYPRTECWPEWRWVGTSRGGYWTVRTVCRTVTNYSTYATAGMRVNWASSAPAVAMIASPGYSVTDATGNIVSPLITALGAGSTDISASTFGAVAGPRRVTVLQSLVLRSAHGNAPGRFADAVREIGVNQAFGLYPTTPAPVASDLTISFSHTSQAILPGLRSTMIIGAGTTGTVGMTVIGRAAGEDTIIATAPGYGPDTVVVRVGIGRTRVVNWPASLSIGDSAAIRIEPLNPPGLLNDGAYNTTFALTASGNLRFSDGTAPITSIPHIDASYSTATFWVVAVGAGTGTLTVSSPDYVASLHSVSITGQTLSFLPKRADVVAGWVASQRVTVPIAMSADVSFNISSRNQLLVAEPGTSNYTYPGQTGTYVLRAGSTFKLLSIAGLDGVSLDTLIASAPGFGPDTAIITLVLGRILVTGWPASLQVGDSAALQLSVADQAGNLGSLGYPITFALTGSPGIVFSNGTAATTSVGVQQRTSNTFYVKAIAAGSQAMTISHRDYLPYNSAVLAVTAPPPIDQSTLLASMAFPRSGTAVAAHGGLLYAIGGWTNFVGLKNSNEAYNPATNLWTTIAPIPTARWYGAAGVVDGLIYVLGGKTEGCCSTLPTVEAYAPATDSWTTRAPMPRAREQFGVAVHNGLIYAIGGWTPDCCAPHLATVDAYDPVTNTWTPRAPMPAPRAGHAVAVVNGRFYVVGGENAAGFQAPVFEYDPVSNTWASKASIITPRTQLGAASVDGVIYALGGWLRGNNGGVNTIEAYDPATNSWATKSPLNIPRFALGVAALNGGIYAVGGTNQILDVPQLERYRP